VCAIIETVLRERGFRVAKYTSPHLVSFAERMVVGGTPVEDAAVVEFIQQWTPAMERIGATFFEATTAMAFHLFATARPDVAVVEVGLGGRLDATNVIDPTAAVVTSIGLDHADYLGSTLEAIALEKAGIFKRQRAAVIGEPNDAIADLLARAAGDAGATPVSIVQRDTPVADVHVATNGTSFRIRASGQDTRLRTSLVGAHQATNAATALRALDLLPEPWRTGPVEAGASLDRVVLPGRFHRHGKFIFDIAHNPDGAAVLSGTIVAVDPARPLVAVLSVLGDKDWRRMIETLALVVDRIILTTAPTSPASRAWDPAVALREATERGWPCVLERDFDAALTRAEREAATVLVTGSVHTVGDAMARLHVSPLAG
jgi:dihydrofolate synthase/folylpolyglutamate synthase